MYHYLFVVLVTIAVFFLRKYYLNRNSLEKVFTKIYLKNRWGSRESVSGSGSTLSQTTVIRTALPELCKNFAISTILDAPCGDFNWLKQCNLDDYHYIGLDIVKEIIEKNSNHFGSERKVFIKCDVTHETIPAADLILCRDLLVHLSFNDIIKTLKNFKNSKSKYLLVTTFIGEQRRKNLDIIAGQWRPLNLQKPPFNFPKPLFIINENCTEQNGLYNDKSLGLWKLDDIAL